MHNNPGSSQACCQEGAGQKRPSGCKTLPVPLSGCSPSLAALPQAPLPSPSSPSGPRQWQGQRPRRAPLPGLLLPLCRGVCGVRGAGGGGVSSVGADGDRVRFSERLTVRAGSWVQLDMCGPDHEYGGNRRAYGRPSYNVRHHPQRGTALVKLMCCPTTVPSNLLKQLVRVHTGESHPAPGLGCVSGRGLPTSSLPGRLPPLRPSCAPALQRGR